MKPAEHRVQAHQDRLAEARFDLFASIIEGMDCAAVRLFTTRRFRLLARHLRKRGLPHLAAKVEAYRTTERGRA